MYRADYGYDVAGACAFAHVVKMYGANTSRYEWMQWLGRRMGYLYATPGALVDTALQSNMECYQACQATPGCDYWTYFDENFTLPAWKQTCILRKKVDCDLPYGIGIFAENKWSGPRDCGAKKLPEVGCGLKETRLGADGKPYVYPSKDSGCMVGEASYGLAVTSCAMAPFVGFMGSPKLVGIMNISANLFKNEYVYSAEACRAACQNFSDAAGKNTCDVWTWIGPGAGLVLFNNSCFLKSTPCADTPGGAGVNSSDYWMYGLTSNSTCKNGPSCAGMYAGNMVGDWMHLQEGKFRAPNTARRLKRTRRKGAPGTQASTRPRTHPSSAA